MAATTATTAATTTITTAAAAKHPQARKRMGVPIGTPLLFRFNDATTWNLNDPLSHGLKAVTAPPKGEPSAVAHPLASPYGRGGSP